MNGVNSTLEFGSDTTEETSMNTNDRPNPLAHPIDHVEPGTEAFLGGELKRRVEELRRNEKMRQENRFLWRVFWTAGAAIAVIGASLYFRWP